VKRAEQCSAALLGSEHLAQAREPLCEFLLLWHIQSRDRGRE
jgi:hypothetical protein